MIASVLARAGLALGLLLGLALATLAPAGADVDLGGTPVAVSTDAANPTQLMAGVWSDVLTGPGASPAQTHRFRYDRTMDQSTVLIGLTAASPELDGDSIGISVTTPEGTDCGDQTASSEYGTPQAPYGVAVIIGPEYFEDAESDCLRAQSLDFAVSRGTSTLTSELPVVIRIVEQVRTATPEVDLLQPPDIATASVPTPGDPTELAGAESFDDAPQAGTGTYAAEIAEGETRLFRVPLGWGQQLAARVDLPAREGEVDVAPNVGLALYDPLRDNLGSGVDEAVPGDSYDVEAAQLFNATPPVAYLNRFDGQPASVPGDYWVAVSVSPVGANEEGREPIDVPITLTIEVSGDAGGDGAPRFPEVVSGPGGTATPEGYSAATPFLIDDGVFAAEVSQSPRQPPGSTDAGGTAQEGDADTRRTAGLVLAAISGAMLMAGIVLLLRRRLSPPAAR